MGQCYNSIVVDAPASEVWNALRNFHDLSWAAGVIESLDVVGDKGAFEAGARRLLNGVFAETLIDLDDESKTIRYSINDGPGPMATAEVASYEGRAQVFPITATDQSFVLWTSEYKANDEPAVGELCKPHLPRAASGSSGPLCGLVVPAASRLHRPDQHDTNHRHHGKDGQGDTP